MRRLFIALSVVALLLLVAGVGTAAAEPPSQDVGQLAGSDQDAVGAAGTAQQSPANTNAPVSVLSPGGSGPVSQSNDASSSASAGNLNITGQSANQTQSGAGLQVIGQSETSAQDAIALAFTLQNGASNTNTPVLEASPGAGAPVTQSNDASSDAQAGNLNGTGQTAGQSQAGAGCPCYGGGEQVIGQAAGNEQQAGAFAGTIQTKPSNENVSVRVLSPGTNGPVTQSNSASSDATAANLNGTKQTAGQTQAGGGSQTIGQAAGNAQTAGALATTIQEKPSNTNISVRVLSPGSNGPVTQTNDASSNATAANLNGTHQTANQTQTGGSCGCGAGSQVIGQLADNDQHAAALAGTVQVKPSNENVSVRVLSPGSDGAVTQTNTASSDATAANLNGTHQSANQTQTGGSCGCGAGSQIIGQLADNDQHAAALAGTVQVSPSNENISVRVLSPGKDGPVTQRNEATSNADAVNLNGTKQSAAQTQSGSGLQVIGQAAKSEQDAFALGLTFQLGASNENAPVRVLSPGHGGPVSQSNVASSDASAANVNWTDQSAAQRQAGGHDACCSGSGIQAIGQLAQNRQGAAAIAATFQVFAKPRCGCHGSSSGNVNAPVRVLSWGHDGPVRQSNNASSDATAVNGNATGQHASQAQGGGCGCGHYDIQAIGQSSDSAQHALAASAVFQLFGLRKVMPAIY